MGSLKSKQSSKLKCYSVLNFVLFFTMKNFSALSTANSVCDLRISGGRFGRIAMYGCSTQTLNGIARAWSAIQNKFLVEIVCDSFSSFSHSRTVARKHFVLFACFLSHSFSLRTSLFLCEFAYVCFNVHIRARARAPQLKIHSLTWRWRFKRVINVVVNVRDRSLDVIELFHFIISFTHSKCSFQNRNERNEK